MRAEHHRDHDRAAGVDVYEHARLRLLTATLREVEHRREHLRLLVGHARTVGPRAAGAEGQS